MVKTINTTSITSVFPFRDGYVCYYYINEKFSVIKSCHYLNQLNLFHPELINCWLTSVVWLSGSYANVSPLVLTSPQLSLQPKFPSEVITTSNHWALSRLLTFCIITLFNVFHFRNEGDWFSTRYTFKNPVMTWSNMRHLSHLCSFLNKSFLLSGCFKLWSLRCRGSGAG